MAIEKKQMMIFNLAVFMSYLTNFGLIFGGSDFETNLGLTNFFISLFLYFFILKYIFKYHDKFLVEKLKILANTKKAKIFSVVFNKYSLYSSLLLIIGTIILFVVSERFTYLFVHKDISKYYYVIPNVNLWGLIIIGGLFLIVFPISNLIYFFRLTDKIKKSLFYNLIFSFSFIFFIFLSFVFVKFVIEFIVIFTSIAGGAPFGP